MFFDTMYHSLASCCLSTFASAIPSSTPSSRRTKSKPVSSTLYAETVVYNRVELIGVVFGSLSKFLLLVIVMHKWNAMLYLSLFAQMLSSAGFDYGLASGRGMNLGAHGIAYSSVTSKTAVFLLNFIVVWFKLDFSFQGNAILSV